MIPKREKVGQNVVLFWLANWANYLQSFFSYLPLIIHQEKTDSQINFELSYCTNHFSTAQTMEG